MLITSVLGTLLFSPDRCEFGLASCRLLVLFLKTARLGCPVRKSAGGGAVQLAEPLDGFCHLTGKRQVRRVGAAGDTS